MKRIIPLFLTAIILASCGGGEAALPIETYIPNLPEYKNKNVGAMTSDETFAYLDVYEISDFHGAFTYSEADKELGLTRLGSYFDKVREDNPGGTIILSGGDMWQGTADSNLTRGNLCTYAMNIIGFDAMTMGNHEFDWTKKWIENNKNKATFPFLGANIYDKATGKIHDLYKASTVVTRGDYKIGLIGTIGDNIKDSILASAVSDVDFKEELPIVQAEATRLREEENCDVVIWTSHRDLEELYSLATKTNPGVDAVFGGHSHASLEKYNEATGVKFLATENSGHSIAHTRLKINKSTKEVTTDVENSGLDHNPTANTYVEDADIKMVFDQYETDIIGKAKSEYLAKCDATLTKQQYLANYSVRAMYEEVKRLADFKGIEVAATFTNINGGVRKDIQAGDILYGNVYESFPFDNELVLIKTTGEKLKSKFYVASNVAMYTTFDYSKFDSKATYYVLTTDFLESNAKFFKGHGGEVSVTGALLRDAVANQMKIDKNIKAKDYSAAKDEYSNPFTGL